MVSTLLGSRRSGPSWRVAALGFIGSVALGSSALAADIYAQQAKSQRIVLVELYTSQGCSSCPPADQLQAELAERQDVLALTLPVDYWDYLGWHDTLAHPANSERQMGYSRRSESGRVFTPQMVIDGMISAIGGARNDVLQKIGHQEMTSMPVPLTINVKDDKVSIAVPSAPGALNGSDTGKATLWLFPFGQVDVVHIGGGENLGRSVRYSHVVRGVVGLGQWSGAAATFEHTLSDSERAQFGYAAVLQADSIGPVIGVAWAGDTNRIHPVPLAPEPTALADPLLVNMPR